MNTKITFVLAIISGAVLGAAVTHGLHAQTKPKAYAVAELEILDAAALPAFAFAAQAAQTAVGARPLRTGGGKIVAINGGPPPQGVAIIEWQSLEQAQAFYSSKAWKDLISQRDKAVKELRRYVVEVVN